MHVSSPWYQFSEHCGGKWPTSGRFVGTLVTLDGFLPHFFCIKLSFDKRWWTRQCCHWISEKGGGKSAQQKTWKINKIKTSSKRIMIMSAANPHISFLESINPYIHEELCHVRLYGSTGNGMRRWRWGNRKPLNERTARKTRQMIFAGSYIDWHKMDPRCS